MEIMLYVSLSRSLALRVRLKSECGSREFKSKYTRFRILDSTDYVDIARICAPAPSRAERSRARPKRGSRAHARRAPRRPASRQRHASTAHYHIRPLHTRQRRARVRETGREREGEGDKRHTIVSQSWIIQACVHGPTHHPFLLMRRWACACGELFQLFFKYDILYGRRSSWDSIFYAQSEVLFISKSVGMRDSPPGENHFRQNFSGDLPQPRVSNYNF